MGNSIQFSVGMDCSKGIASGKQFIGTVGDMGKQMQSVFGDKLKSIISFAAIEEATRRTGEWALAMTQTAKAIGLSTQSLQTLNLIAQKTGTSESAMQGMVENIKTAAEAALSGNAEMLSSFQRLGVQIDRTDSVATIFSKTMKAIPPPETLNAADAYLRNAVLKITGTPGQVAAGFAQGFNQQAGEGVEGKAAELEKSGSIPDTNTVSDISATWSAIKSDLSETGTMLLPIANALMEVVHWLTTVLSGVVEAITGLGEAIYGLFTGNIAKMEAGTKKWTGIVVNGLIEILNFIPSAIAGIMSHIPGLKKYGEKYKANTAMFKNDVNEYFGFDKETARRGAAVGDAALAVMTGGEAAGADAAAQSAARAAYREAGVSEAGQAAVRSAERSAATKEEGMAAAREIIEKDLAKGARMDARAELVAGQVKKVGWLGGMVASVQAGAANAAGIPTPQVTPPMNERILPQLNPNLGAVQSGGMNLKIGGMFGAGETKLIKMTQRMIDLLGQIAMNTSPWNGNPNRMTGSGGGQGVAGGR